MVHHKYFNSVVCKMWSYGDTIEYSVDAIETVFENVVSPKIRIYAVELFKDGALDAIINLVNTCNDRYDEIVDLKSVINSHSAT